MQIHIQNMVFPTPQIQSKATISSNIDELMSLIEQIQTIPISNEVIITDDEGNEIDIRDTRGYLYRCSNCGIFFPQMANVDGPTCPNCGEKGEDGRWLDLLYPKFSKLYTYKYIVPPLNITGVMFNGAQFDYPLSKERILERLSEWAADHFENNIPDILEIHEIITYVAGQRAYNLGRFSISKKEKS